MARPFVDGDMVVRALRVPAKDVVFVKGVILASEGLAAVFADQDGTLICAAPRSRERELELVLSDLARELETEVLLDTGSARTSPSRVRDG